MYKFNFECLGVHCDQCNDVMGWTFDCPVCKAERVTNIWAWLNEWFEDDDGFACSHCGTIFTAKTKVGYYNEWEFDIK